MISYFLVGGAASITFVTILTRYRETGREEEGERSLSVILSTMYLVLGGAIVLAEGLRPWYVHKFFNGFDAEKAASASSSRAFCCQRSCSSLQEECLVRCCSCASNSMCRPWLR